MIKKQGGEFVKIITLIENTQGEESCASEHGLSLYIETEKHKFWQIPELPEPLRKMQKSWE